MSTPATLKQREIAREKAAKRNANMIATGMMPLSALYNHSPSMNFRIRRTGAVQNVNASGGQGTNEGGTRGSPKSSAPPQVEKMPAGMSLDEYKVDPDKIVCFNGRQHFLSNLYAAPVVIEGHEYPSVEHYYQACKLYTLGGPDLALRVRNIADPGEVKVYAKSLLRTVNVPFEKVEEWKRTLGPVLLYHAIIHKYVQNADIRELLMQTDDAILAHAYLRDNFFATGCNRDAVVEWAKKNKGNILKVPKRIECDTIKYIPLIAEGKNILGLINMKIREEVRTFQEHERDTSDPILLAALQTLRLNGSPKGDGGVY